MKVGNTVFVVTGAGSGMGQALTLALLARGARVAAVDVRHEGLAETVRLAAADDRLPGPDDRLSVHVLDITDVAAVGALPDAVIRRHGDVDGLINNAGIIQPFVTVEDIDLATIRRVIDVNLWGTIHMVKAFLPHLRKRPQAHIANVSSMGGFVPVPGQVVYGASKAAVKLLTEGLYAELVDTDIRVSVIMPGAVGTNIVENSGAAIPALQAAAATARVTTPADAATTILDGIEADRLHILVGRDARLMHLAVRLSPRRATHLIQKQMKRILSL